MQPIVVKKTFVLKDIYVFIGFKDFFLKKQVFIVRRQFKSREVFFKNNDLLRGNICVAIELRNRLQTGIVAMKIAKKELIYPEDVTIFWHSFDII
jgi:hypothetical protein